MQRLDSTDLSYTDTVGRVERPKTGLRKEGSTREDSFDDLDDSFLPMWIKNINAHILISNCSALTIQRLEHNTEWFIR